MEYREWDPFKSRFAAAILSGAQDISIKPGSRVLVLNSRDDALSGMTISHISDIVGPQGMVYVVEEASHSLLTMASKRFNIIPIVYGEIPHKYRMLINVVDVLFAALDSPKERYFDKIWSEMEAVVDRLLVLGVLNLYDFFRFAVNFTYVEAYGVVLATIPEIVVPMMARSVNVGHTPGVLEGDAFLYRCQMVLVGLHQDWIRGISLGMDGYDEVETCCVAIFPLHDFLVNENSFIYGGEGGFLREAHMLHMRVLADQDWQSPGNFALLRSMDCATAVRLVHTAKFSGSTTLGTEQGRWQAELSQAAIELIWIVANLGRASTLVASYAATPTLRRIERAAIAAATPITNLQGNSCS
ncbi:unnamed protein product [Trifolium pratense]|uniref:Uncharacterized protein n=1 Tax=Trifolium pratense TaxID=57577 RepID=A0ACB0ITJ9_TRIPR|nr:unnamed protein product [Trifolium pratense]